MKRRSFIEKTLLTGSAVSLSGAFSFARTKRWDEPHHFNLKYAPHLGMFKHHAGEDPLIN